MQGQVRPLLLSLVALLAPAVGFGAAAEETLSSQCLGEGCSPQQGLGADEEHEQSLVQLNLVKHNAKKPTNKARMDDTRSAGVIESMVQGGHITTNMARGLSNASLLLEAAHSAGLSTWTLTDAEDHIAAAVKELRSKEHLSRAGPGVAGHGALVPVTTAVSEKPDWGGMADTIPKFMSATFAIVSGVRAGVPASELIGPALTLASAIFGTAAIVFSVTFPPLGIGLAITAAILDGLVSILDENGKEKTPTEELYERIMDDMHIVLNRALMGQYLKDIVQDTMTLSEEIAWAPTVMNESSPEYSSIASLTYELMAHHDCASISNRIRTEYRTGTLGEKRDWAKAVMPVAEVVAATQASLLMSIGSHGATTLTAISNRLKDVFIDKDSSWAPMFREWLEDIRRANLQDRNASLGEWTYTECTGWYSWSTSRTRFIGECHEDGADVCYTVGCLGGDEAKFDDRSDCEQWHRDDRMRKEQWNPRSLHCRPQYRDMWLKSVYDAKRPNQWNRGMVAEEKHYNEVSGLLAMQIEGSVKFLDQALAERPVVAKGLGESLPTGEPLLGQCQGDCDSDSECQGNLVCGHRDGDAPLAAQCVGGVSADLSHVDFCIVPELKHLGWHNVDWHFVPYGSKSRGAVMKVCEGHCTSDADCEGDLTCYKVPTGHRNVPGCWGLPVPDMKYCIAFRH